MLKVTKKQVMDALRDRGAFTLKRNAEYQVGIKNNQIAVYSINSNESSYLGNTLESAIKLSEIMKEHGTEEQQDQVNKSIMDLMPGKENDDEDVLGEEWSW
ncbi:hypothetical protein FOF74_006455 [Lactobacillus gasseri]|jgi:hypothetical protein|uniref:hypothetical protein n=1 Tax=Lactobacillus TaxID=1578 RepID=UPI00034224F0|nr:MULTISPECIES: hypothetical protein [Lactobacillus]KDA99145.1 hypothetical protein LK7_003695 [Lactobacillus paragasseri K7]MDK7211203.1 hypothetical protein [Lactobacillus gasseri]MDK8141276.1 hypothetical protein [Lactobacillus gasseri]MDK8391349.1 hypothetical protein [Lactobacillus gasseri]MDT9589179.1 hypothetical protein [Lactobacillus paragasseri]